MTRRPSSWRRTATAIGTLLGATIPATGMLMDQAYVMVVTATAFAAMVGVLLVLAVRAFNALLPIYADRATIENDLRRLERLGLTSGPESVNVDRRPPA